MNLERVKEQASKYAPILLIFYFGYLYMDLSDFESKSDSPLIIAKNELVANKDEIAKLKKRQKEVEEFRRSLESKRLEIRKNAEERQSMCGYAL